MRGEYLAKGLVDAVLKGTTSACAENTNGDRLSADIWGNYLRVRGEYLGGMAGANLSQELPPRARRIRPMDSVTSGAIGTTSACAENTRVSICAASDHRNYLRVRGEYAWVKAVKPLLQELPPRARRIRRLQRQTLGFGGTTSACAENTNPGHSLSPHERNYLRVRGEYIASKMQQALRQELPPRARRIRLIGW